MFKDVSGTNLLAGAVLILAASALAPAAGKNLRPLAVWGVKGALGLIDETRTRLFLAKEEAEDIWAEAQFERMKNRLDKEIASGSGAHEAG